MPLKPGEVKAIKVQLGKIAGLQELKKKLNQMLGAQDNVKYGQSTAFSAKLQKQLKSVSDQIKLEIDDVKKKIEAAKKPVPTKKMPAANAKIVKMIATDCSNYIDEFKKAKKVLFRGIESHTDKPVFVGRSWDNRQPKDSSASAQKSYDEMLKKLGIKALRSNSIFTTASLSHASNYGKVYAIIPKNSAFYSWSQVYKDIVLKSGSQMDDAKIKLFCKNFLAHLKKTQPKMKSYSREDKMYSLMYAIKDKSDAKAKKLMTTFKFPIPEGFTFKMFQADESAWEKKYMPTDKNLGSALKKGHEVMIAGEYYAITLSNNASLASEILTALGIPNTFAKSYNDDDYDDDDEY